MESITDVLREVHRIRRLTVNELEVAHLSIIFQIFATLSSRTATTCSSTPFTSGIASILLGRRCSTCESDLRPCSRPAHDQCRNCLGLLQSALKKQLSLQNATLSSLKIYSKCKMTSTDLEGLLEIADVVYYERMGNSPVSHRLTRTGDADVSELGQTH